MLLTLLSLVASFASAADLTGDGCEDSYFDANSACVAPSATIGSGVTIGSSAVVGELATIGADTSLAASTFVAARVTLVGRAAAVGARPVGTGTVLGRATYIDADHDIGADNTFGRNVDAGERLVTDANVSIGYGTILGDDITVHAGAVIGNLAGLGDNTTVETNAVLARGVTILSSSGSSSIDGLIGPNVSIGGNNTIDATARIRKDATLGNDVTVLGGARIARGAIIGDGVTIGANARIGAGATVTATTLVPDDAVIPRGETYDDPSVGVFVGGTMLSQSEMDQINGWIGDPNANWTLCWKGSTDGFSAGAFHSGCDGIAGTVTVIDASGKKFGGYTPLLWNHASAYRTETPRTSFLFSLTNNFKHLPYRYTHDIYAHSAYGPTFGGGHDLTFYPNNGSSSYCNIGHNYQCRVGAYADNTCRTDFCGAYNFSTNDIEVYGRD